MKPFLIDSHAHLDDNRFLEDGEEAIQRARDSNVAKIINIGADLQSSSRTLGLAAKYDFIYASVGVHPHSAAEYNDKAEKELYDMARKDKVVAIGEIGLDYHYDNSPREKQKEAFKRQLAVASTLDLPVVIHNREAHRDCLDILTKERNERQRGVFHCYSGSAEMVREVIGLDFYISFAGVITFRNARKAVEALREVPLDRLLFETDCPYLSPEPRRGKRNEPSYIRYTAEKISEILSIGYDELCRTIWENAHRLFNRLPKDNHMIE